MYCLRGFSQINNPDFIIISCLQFDHYLLPYIDYKVVTVNCARIIHGNQVSTNGVVHVIDRVITVVEDTIHNVLDNTEELSTLRVRV